MTNRSKRKVAWLAVPLEPSDTTFEFADEDSCRQWIAQPFCSERYRARAVVMAQCKCCGLFHIQKPSESVTSLLGKEVADE